MTVLEKVFDGTNLSECLHLVDYGDLIGASEYFMFMVFSPKNV